MGIMGDRDLRVRNATYGLLVDLGHVPAAQDVAQASTNGVADVLASWQRLHDQHALVLNRATAEIRMANPFSAIPSAYRIKAASRWWYANCAWDALGVCAALHADGIAFRRVPTVRDDLLTGGGLQTR